MTVALSCNLRSVRMTIQMEMDTEVNDEDRMVYCILSLFKCPYCHCCVVLSCIRISFTYDTVMNLRNLSSMCYGWNHLLVNYHSRDSNHLPQAGGGAEGAASHVALSEPRSSAPACGSPGGGERCGHVVDAGGGSWQSVKFTQSFCLNWSSVSYYLWLV